MVDHTTASTRMRHVKQALRWRSERIHWIPWDIVRCDGVEFDVTDLSRSSWDPLGFPVEFFQEIPPAPRLLRRYDLYRGASVMGLDHVNFHHPDPERGRAYYRSLGIVSVS